MPRAQPTIARSASAISPASWASLVNCWEWNALSSAEFVGTSAPNRHLHLRTVSLGLMCDAMKSGLHEKGRNLGFRPRVGRHATVTVFVERRWKTTNKKGLRREVDSRASSQLLDSPRKTSAPVKYW